MENIKKTICRRHKIYFILLLVVVLYFCLIQTKLPTILNLLFPGMASHWYQPEMFDGSPQALSAYLIKQHTIPDVKTSEGGIQIFAIIKWTLHEEYLCLLDCDDRVVFMDAQVKIFLSVHSFPYMLVDLHCHNPCTLATVIKVAVTTKSQNMTQSSFVQIQSFNESEPPRDLTVCISAFSNYDRRRLLQHVSAYQHLGTEKIYIYQSETSVEMQKMLPKFLQGGCVEVINWKVDAILRPANATDLIQALQWAAWRDCIYRNKRGSQNLVLTTSDQNGLLTKGYAWTGMLQVFRKENFSINDMEVRDCARYVATSDDAGRQEKSTEGAQVRCGDATIKPLLRTDTTFAVLTLAAEPSTKKNLSPLAQCLGSTASQEQVTFVQLRIQEKEKASSLVKPVRDAQALVVSAFYEDRQQKDLILIIGIVKRSHYEKGQGALYCHVPCGNAIHVRPIGVDIHGDHFGFPYGMASLTCTNPCGSTALTNVTVSASSDGTSSGVTLTIHNTKDSRPPEPQWDFTVCTSTMFNSFSNVLQLIQSLEMYQLLGARKVVIYKTSCSDQVQEVLDYYVKEGFVQVLEWTVNLYLNPSTSWSFKLHKADLHYHGQIVALNDCLYRYMYSSRYLVLIDQDEIIVPYKHNNWRDLIDSLREVTPGANIFRFSNRIFPTDTYDKDPGALQWNDVPGVNVLQFVNRETKLEWFDPKKMIVDPRIAYKTSVHQLAHHFGKVKEVNEWEALMFHCKEHKVISEPRKDLRLLDYKAQLRVNVNQVLSQTLRRFYPFVVTPVDGVNVFIVSAFYDNRTINELPWDVIRIIGIVKRDHFEGQQQTLHCHVECQNVSHRHDVHVQLHDDHHNFPYGTADLLCQNPCGSADLIRVAVSTSDVRSSSDVYLNVGNSKFARPSKPQRNFTVCISVMAGHYDDVLQLIQSIEMYRLLGADRIFIYKTNCSAEVQKVLDYYTAEGFLVVFNWTVDSYFTSSEIYNHGQNVAFHDCLYRNMYTSRYLVLNSPGEVILPYRHNTWKDLLDSLKNQNSRLGIFMFSGHVFHRSTNPKVSGGTEWEGITGMNMLHHIYREKEAEGSESKKVILDPLIVQKVCIPELQKLVEDVKEVDENDALLFLCENHAATSSGLYDPRILNFESKLNKHVKAVLSETIKR
uniref:Uncharacterized LOC114656996 n=1 Tax=Erpetoichthys calabaricus TaxID=27687 RepID=A0A8C4SHV7_ERPCA